ncbi:MAG TPA: SAM-dependent methyltransferase, partial [Candidatus Limnocylindrales bacterium]|nr:SAM-dependent methyltransferase [Candidatus Limnocylindrales bacterium]
MRSPPAPTTAAGRSTDQPAAQLMQAGRRQVAVPVPPADDPGSPELLALLRGEIDAGGPITFARYMQRALYEPGLGYYATSAERPTRAGDFLTAPELHPIFGRVLARQIKEMWRLMGEPADFVVREYGASRGTLGAALPAHLRYQPIEFADPVPDEPLVGVVLANELLDALPVHRVVARGGDLHELYVSWRDGRLVEVEGELSTPALGEWFAAAGAHLTDGQRAEACLAMGDWLAEVGATLERGYVLIIDYGDDPAALYGSDRYEGTLRAFRGHHVGRDVLAGVGRQDLTATVDLGALERLSAVAGLDWLGRTTQAEFLVGAGLEQVLAEERERVGEDWQSQLELRAAIGRLLDPRA